jgi:hypothetical protein
MKTGPNSRRYVIPAAWLATALAAYAFGYMTKDVFFSPTAAEQDKATAALAAQNGGANSSTDPATAAAAARVGGTFTDAGGTGATLTVGQVTGGQPLDEWLKKLMTVDDDTFRMTQFMKLFEALNTPEDIKAALKVLADSNKGGGGGGPFGGRGGGRFTEASMLLQKLTKLDPKAALAVADAATGGEKFMAMSTVSRTWAKTDPDAALAWAKANGAPKAEGAEAGGAGGPGGGFPGGNENWALSGVITQIAKTDIDKAMTEASTLEGRMGGRTADALVGEMISQKGLDAARKAADALPAGEFKNDFIQQLAGKYAAEDPAAASAWANSMATGDTKSRALRETVQEWTKKDAVAAGAFVGGLPVGADSDSARSVYALNVAAKDQASALASVSKITDADRQVRTVGEIAGTLARKDVASGQAFLASSPIADQAKAQISQAISQPQRVFGNPGGGGPGGGGGGRGGRGGR